MNKEMKFFDLIKMCPANGFDFMTQSGYLRLTTHDANKLTLDSIIYGHPGFPDMKQAFCVGELWDLNVMYLSERNGIISGLV